MDVVPLGRAASSPSMRAGHGHLDRVGVVAVIAAVGAVVMVALIGESGARAVWGGLA